MGCFGYICKHCSTPIIGHCFEGGEKCVLIHVREGKEIGRVVGHYNEYGSIFEESTSDPTRFRGKTGPNSHEEIHKSEYRLPDSIGSYSDYRYYNGTLMTYQQYLRFKAEEMENLEETEVYKNLPNYRKERLAIFKNSPEDYKMFLVDMVVSRWDTDGYDREVFYSLPKYKSTDGLAKSGIAAYHHRCYQIAEKRGTLDLLPSDEDPNQSCGKVRKNFR